MNNSTLYHTWGAKGFDVVRTWYTKEGTFIKLNPQKRLHVCPICGSKEVTTRGSVDRTIKTLPVGFREECFFVVNVPRLHCHSCEGLHYLDIKIADQRKSYTKQLANLIALLFCIATISDISSLLNMNWATVKEIVKLFLEKKFSKPDLSNITMISIDEISTHKGHKYVTVVIDALTGRPLYVGDGKGEDALDGFWKVLGPIRRKRIQAVAIDIWAELT
jgi:transposase